MPNLPKTCPLCSSVDPLNDYHAWFQAVPDPRDNTLQISCHRCGRYLICEDIADDTDGQAELRRFGLQLSAAARYETDRKGQVQISYENYKTIAKRFELPSTKFAFFDRVLELLAEAQPLPGLSTPQLVRPQVAARVLLPDKALEGILESLQETGLVHLEDRDAIRLALRITAEGWRRVDELRRTSKGIRDRVFVAMAFNEGMRPAYDQGIYPALVASGYDATE